LGCAPAIGLGPGAPAGTFNANPALRDLPAPVLLRSRRRPLRAAAM